MQETGTMENLQARDFALEQVRTLNKSATSPVGYRSSGRLLLIGEPSASIPLAKRLQKHLHCTVLLQGADGKGFVHDQQSEDQVRIVQARLFEVEGYLGAYKVIVEDHDQQINLATLLGEKDECFDLVLDLQTPPAIDREILPPGYYAPKESVPELERILEELPDLVGEFEKPKYFQYNADICAHEASGLTGCRQCIDACPTEAIVSIGDKVEVNPYLCQGGGSCATACPSGAMTFAYPPVSETLDLVRALVRHYREAGGQTPFLLFHDAMVGRHTLDPVRERFAGNIIPVEIEEIGAVGMDVWLAALAYGINRTLLLVPPTTPERVQRTLKQQLKFAAAVIEGIGYSANHILLIETDKSDALLAHLESLEPEPEIHPATFSGEYDKRTTLRMAIDHLYRHSMTQTPSTPLPAGAPFGEVIVQKSACTLCLACVSVCPTAALSDGNDVPQLRFDEWNCVQCGLCETACPENAITRKPRMLYDPEVRRRTRVLNEDEPFCCVVCGKPFATSSVMRTIATKLKDHYMYQTEESRRRIQMCEDCRVRDMFKQEAN